MNSRPKFQSPARLRSRRGQALIEFTLTIFIVLFVVFAIIEFCSALYAFNVLGDAAREGVRYAIVHGANNTNCSGGSATSTPPGCDPTGSNIVGIVKDYARYSLKDTSAITVTVTYLDGSNTPQNRVKVDVSYTYVPWINVPWIGTLRTSAQGRIIN